MKQVSKPKKKETKKKSRPKPKRLVKVGPLHGYLRTKPWGESKILRCDYKPGCVRVNDVVAVASDTGLASSLVDEGTVYRFRLAGSTSVTSASNKFDGFIAADPSSAGVNFAEWSTLSALFSEFKLVELRAQMVIADVLNSTPPGVSAPFMVCSNLGTAIAPGSYAAVADNADSKIVSLTNATNVVGYTHVMRSCGDLGWSQVTTPTVEPFAGAPGSIQFFASAVPNGLVLEMIIAGIYDFRSRV